MSPTLRRLIAALCGMLMWPNTAAAQTDWTYGGFADIAYLFAPNDPANDQFRSRGTAWHLNGVYLNMAGVYARRPPTESARWGLEATIHSGKDDEVFGFSATAPNLRGHEWLKHLGPTNVSYLTGVGSGLVLQGGIFSSLIGFDSLYARDNLNYTRPWGADFTPYLMLGVNASYPVTDRLTATGFVVNGYWHLAHANAVPSTGAQLAYSPAPRVVIKQTVMAGPHQSDTRLGAWRVTSDTIVERRTARFITAFNFQVAAERVRGTTGERAWWMAAQLPMQWQIGARWRMALRGEVAWDSIGRWTLAEQTVRAFTTTLEHRRSWQSLAASVRLEHRVDHSTGPGGGFFTARTARAALTPTQHLAILALVLRFDGPRP